MPEFPGSDESCEPRRPCGRRGLGRSLSEQTTTCVRRAPGVMTGTTEEGPMKDSDPRKRVRLVSRRNALRTLGGAGLGAVAMPFVVRRAAADSTQLMGPGG